ICRHRVSVHKINTTFLSLMANDELSGEGSLISLKVHLFNRVFMEVACTKMSRFAQAFIFRNRCDKLIKIKGLRPIRLQAMKMANFFDLSFVSIDSRDGDLSKFLVAILFV